MRYLVSIVFILVTFSIIILLTSCTDDTVSKNCKKAMQAKQVAQNSMVLVCGIQDIIISEESADNKRYLKDVDACEIAKKALAAAQLLESISCNK